MNRLLTDKNIASFTLLIMSVQLITFEGMDISMPKVVFMACTPLLILFRTPNLSKAIVFSVLFWIVTVAMSVFQHGTNRMSTFYYTALFLSTFCLYYNLINYNNAFTLDEFLKLIKIVIMAYFIVLLLQQICLFFGYSEVPIINLMDASYYTIMHVNSLAIEPSHAARILTVMFYALLKLEEIHLGTPPSLSYLWHEHKFIILMFLYTMIALGSGTAFVGLAILFLYFLRRQYVMMVLIGAFLCYMLSPFIHFEPLDRAINVFNAALSMDAELVTETDYSASTRVNLLINTYNNFDITDSSLWFGYGVDADAAETGGVVSGMADYGLISYIFKLILFFSCCFTGLFSLEILIFILLFSLNIGNIAYGWSALMVFSTIKYFYELRYEEVIDSDTELQYLEDF